MGFARNCAMIALLALTACGGSGTSKSDVIAACKASVEAMEKEMAAKFSSYTAPTAAVMEEKLDCCNRMIDGSKIPGGALSFLVKEYEYRTLRSTSDDNEVVMKAHDKLSEARSKLSDKERDVVSATVTLVTSCTMRAGRR